MWARSLAALLLGLPLTVGVIGLAALTFPGDPEVTTLPWMMLVVPVWVVITALAFAGKTALHTWLWLGGATVISLLLLYEFKALGLIGA